MCDFPPRASRRRINNRRTGAGHNASMGAPPDLILVRPWRAPPDLILVRPWRASPDLILARPWLRLLIGILDHYEEILFIWCHHDLVLLGADPEEGEVVGGVEVAHSGARLVAELVDQARVLDRQRVLQRAPDGDTFLVDNNGSYDTFVGLYSLQCFLYFRCHDNKCWPKLQLSATCTASTQTSQNTYRTRLRSLGLLQIGPVDCPILGTNNIKSVRMTP